MVYYLTPDGGQIPLECATVFVHALREHGILDWNEDRFVKLKLKVSQAFKFAMADSTHHIETHLIILLILQVMLSKGLEQDACEIDKAFVQRLRNNPSMTQIFREHGVPLEYEKSEPTLNQRILQRIVELEREGRL